MEYFTPEIPVLKGGPVLSVYQPKIQIILITILTVSVYLFTPTPALANTEHCGNITTDEVWTASANVHIVTCDVEIMAGSTLTIEAGAIVKFEGAYTQLLVHGKLVAVGTPGNIIHFTSIRDDSVGGDTNGDEAATTPAVGNWGNILFYNDSDDDSVISYAAVRYGGQADCCGVNDGSITLDDASPTLSFISFQDNYINGAQIQGNRIWSTDTWDSTSVVYVIEGGDVTVPLANSLTINEGVVVKSVLYGDLKIDGKLTVSGSITSPVYFTSHLDDTVCGTGAAGETVCDTHNDGGSAGKVGDWGGIQFNSTSDDSSSITRAVIRFSGKSECCGIRHGGIKLDNASPDLSYISFANNYVNGVYVQGGVDWQTDTWDNTSIIYVVEGGDLTVPALNTLTIEPDVKIKLDLYSDIYVSGKLQAAGTKETPIFFTSKKDDTVCGIGALNEQVCDTNNDEGSAGSAGDWGQIQFNSNSDDSSNISRAIIRHSGKSECCGNRHGAIELDNASPTLSNISFTKNYINGALLKTGINWLSDTWDSTSVIYVIEGGNITVPFNNTLSVGPGVIVKLNDDANIHIDGKFVSAGTDTVPVHISSVFDDLLCGVGALDEPVCDTHNDGGTSGDVGSWGQILFSGNSDDSSSIKNTYIEYSGGVSCCGARDAAILLDNASPTIQNSVIRNGYDGIETIGNSAPNLSCNDIYNNTNFGIYNVSSPNSIVAENHWWGDASGPSHDNNPSGTGQAVSDGVDYSPWATASLCFTAPPPPKLEVSPNALTLNTTTANNPPSKSVTIAHNESTSLNWTASTGRLNG